MLIIGIMHFVFDDWQDWYPTGPEAGGLGGVESGAEIIWSSRTTLPYCSNKCEARDND